MTLTSYTLSTLQADLINLLGDKQGTSWSTSQLTDAINLGIKRLCALKHYTYQEAAVPISQTTTGESYGVASLYSTSPSFDYRDYIEIRRCYWQGTYLSSNYVPTVELVHSTLETEAERNANWRSLAGQPERWLQRDGATILVTPYSGGYLPTTNVLTVCYIQAPTLLALPADLPDPRIPYAVQQYIKYAAASWLLSLDQTDTTALQTAKMYMDTFVGLVGV